MAPKPCSFQYTMQRHLRFWEGSRHSNSVLDPLTYGAREASCREAGTLTSLLRRPLAPFSVTRLGPLLC